MTHVSYRLTVKISSGTLRSVIEYGLPLPSPFVTPTCTRAKFNTSSCGYFVGVWLILDAARGGGGRCCSVRVPGLRSADVVPVRRPSSVYHVATGRDGRRGQGRLLSRALRAAQATMRVPVYRQLLRQPRAAGLPSSRFRLLLSVFGWLGSQVVSVLDSGAVGPGFKSQSRRCRVTVLYRQTVHTHRASVHQAATLVAALLRVARVTAGLAESNGSLPPGL